MGLLDLVLWRLGLLLRGLVVQGRLALAEQVLVRLVLGPLVLGPLVLGLAMGVLLRLCGRSRRSQFRLSPCRRSRLVLHPG